MVTLSEVPVGPPCRSSASRGGAGGLVSQSPEDATPGMRPPAHLAKALTCFPKSQKWSRTFAGDLEDTEKQ